MTAMSDNDAATARQSSQFRSSPGRGRPLSPLFAYDIWVAERFPAIRGGVIRASGLDNGPSQTELPRGVSGRAAGGPGETRRDTNRRDPFDRGVATCLHSLRSEADTASGSGRSTPPPTAEDRRRPQHQPARRHGRPCLDLVCPPCGRLRPGRGQRLHHGPFANGQERFTDLGATETTNPAPGEVIFVDDDIVSARRWCWRQSSQSATSPYTTNALLTVEALHEDAEADIESALADLLTLLDRHQPQSDSSWRILSADNRVFTIE